MNVSDIATYGCLSLLHRVCLNSIMQCFCWNILDDQNYIQSACFNLSLNILTFSQLHNLMQFRFCYILILDSSKKLLLTRVLINSLKPWLAYMLTVLGQWHKLCSVDPWQWPEWPSKELVQISTQRGKMFFSSFPAFCLATFFSTEARLFDTDFGNRLCMIRPQI